ncbi:DUF1638 domain-containing protein [Hwanghaeella grinnelliae]|uniref:DUF1638 domain-containing protein n=1 Tax=Hwanghaeella grinnelliae TaxID=2500179 RepID=A0A3S2WP85_9PROT|nr:DUF1638 domain-containing protein [Hwanghaeella grinnelliae]RVU33852.1 DUF1638 domain-containing protein [Hwanghaeella grinnelliae]
MTGPNSQEGSLLPEEEATFAVSGEGAASGAAEKRTYVIACGALAREVLDIIALNALPGFAVTCLPAKLHNQPQFIPDRLREKIREVRPKAGRILIGYADCGTGGLIDKVIAEEARDDCPVERIGGAHCYAFFAGQTEFADLAEQELGTFYLTDYLARHFDTLIVKGMGLDKYPGMIEMMFGNYKRLVYLAQIDDPDLDKRAEKAAEKLGLSFLRVRTGYGELAAFLTDPPASPSS